MAGKGSSAVAPRSDEGVVYRRVAPAMFPSSAGGLSFTVLRRCIGTIEHWSAGLGGSVSLHAAGRHNGAWDIIGAVVLAGVKAVSSLRDSGR
ncbi:hypothetical protein MJ561_19135 [Klebsiella pneumoniae]|nr:hypothetical protein MJ561_19135 [Klebsiella pneumoniae]